MSKIHCAYASEKIRRQFGEALANARAEAPHDQKGRIDEKAVSKKMARWWQDHGYAYP
ncbi:hypothetical protein [Magnetospira sp. QH-2]|uniref:hypothetical protein n=1 Tax=Magnetospira sp. (strain QH-2) TaxID=1288970 RepID=UPI00130EBBCC|nr:hypothetical protein [Magnetospira sp. QH-2]